MIKRIMVTRTGGGCCFSTNHNTWEDAAKIFKGLWNSKAYKIELQVEYTDGDSILIDNREGK